MAGTSLLGWSRAQWRKSSYSANGGNCIEVAHNLHGAVAVRDSKDPEGPKLAFGPQAWHRFIATVKAHSHDPG